jgi:hypothetical protein
MKGMQKISRGKGFEGVLKYAFGRDSRFKEPGFVVGGNMSGFSISELSREFGFAHAIRPDIEKPVWHNSLRLPKGDKLTNAEWDKIAHAYMEKMGFSKLHPFVAIEHNDEEGQHIHLIASRVSLIGEIFLGRNENLISTRIIAELEVEHGLTITKGLDYDENNRIVSPKRKVAKVSRGELEKAVRTGEVPVRLQLQNLVNEARKGKPTVVSFIERLELLGVSVHVNISKTGKLNGFSFSLEGIPFKGSDLGEKYTWSSLKKSGVTYEQNRDFEELAKRSGKEISFGGSADSGLSTQNPANRRVSEPVAESVVEPDFGPDEGINDVIGVGQQPVNSNFDSEISGSDVNVERRSVVADREVEFGTGKIPGKNETARVGSAGEDSGKIGLWEIGDFEAEQEDSRVVGRGSRTESRGRRAGSGKRETQEKPSLTADRNNSIYDFHLFIIGSNDRSRVLTQEPLTQEDWRKIGYVPDVFESGPPAFFKDQFVQMRDFGNRLEFSKDSNMVGAGARGIAAAVEKGWSDIEAKGSDEFVIALYQAARDQGFTGKINGVTQQEFFEMRPSQ